MKIIVAPNTFKGSISATQAAKAITLGVREVFPDAELVEIPVADGGEGTVEALVSAHAGTYGWVNVEGPLGDPVLASYGPDRRRHDGSGRARVFQRLRPRDAGGA